MHRAIKNMAAMFPYSPVLTFLSFYLSLALFNVRSFCFIVASSYFRPLDVALKKENVLSGVGDSAHWPQG